MDFHRRMHAARCCAADQQRDVETLPLHFRRHMHHFIKRRRDETGKTDHIDLFGNRRFKDFRRRHHHAEIDDLVIVAGKNDADDVLADIVHITLHGRHKHLAGGLVLLAAIQALFLFHVRKQHGDGLLHHTGGFNHLRQKHLARAKQVTDHVHARHQRPFDNVQRAGGLLARLFRIGFDEFGNAVDQRVLQPLSTESSRQKDPAPSPVFHPCRGNAPPRQAAAPLRRRGGSAPSSQASRNSASMLS